MATPAPHLPSPAENPAGHIVIYDGDCKFCTTGVQKLARWDTCTCKNSASFPCTIRKFELVFPASLTISSCRKCTLSIAWEKSKGAEAFRFLTTQLPRLYPLCPLLYIPFSLPFWKWAYGQVARRRYKILGGGPLRRRRLQHPLPVANTEHWYNTCISSRAPRSHCQIGAMLFDNSFHYLSPRLLWNWLN